MGETFYSSTDLCCICSDLRLLNLGELTAAGVAVDLAEFQFWSRKAIDSVRNQLMNIWYPAIQSIYCLVSHCLSFPDLL